MSRTQLILCSVQLFFVSSKNKDYNELAKLKQIYSMFLENGSKNMELEARLYKNGNPKKNVDKFTFNYLLEFLNLNFTLEQNTTIDVIKNQGTLYDRRFKYRSSYKSFQDLINGKSILNEEKISYFLFDSNKPRSLMERTDTYGFKFEKNKSLYNEILFRMSLSEEKSTSEVVLMGNGNMIRYKERYSFNFSDLWRIDLTKVKSGYSEEQVNSSAESYELECEFIGPKDTSYEVFLSTYNQLYKYLLSNSSYC
jgi:hypothetical protein